MAHLYTPQFSYKILELALFIKCVTQMCQHQILQHMKKQRNSEPREVSMH